MKKSIALISLFTSALLVGCAQQHTNTDDKLSNGIPLPSPEEEIHTVKNEASTPALLQPEPINLYRKVDEDIYTSNYDEHPEVIRYDRYTLVTSTPVDGQKYLLDQLVNVNIKTGTSGYNLNVQQGIQQTLRDTGFVVCQLPVDPNTRTLFQRPLPKVHYKFGTMKLRDALQMLVGEAYELVVDDSLREVCFERRAVVPKRTDPQPQIQSEPGYL